VTINIINLVITAVLALNIFLALTLIFLERRDASATWAWIMILFFIPILGFGIYLLFGRKLRRKHLFRWEGKKKVGIDTLIEFQMEAIEDDSFDFRLDDASHYKELIIMHLQNNQAVLTQDNQVDIFIDGREKFDALMEDLKNAKNHIHIQYYIFRLDNLGNSIYNILLEKVKQGVEVRVLYDAMGSRSLRKRHFKELIDLGGQVEVFFPSVFPLINPRMNYRNHRKIVVIDGRIGYIGGFNVGDEYLGLDKKFGYWRDTHLRIEGSSVHPLQTRFILDWNQASADQDIEYSDRFFPAIPMKGSVGLQIVSSGPDSEWEQIKNGYLKLLMMAKKYIYIQSPYFIPDASFMDTLRIACLSGIDVRIMIPNKPDHIFVYWATYSYVGELIRAGAKVYIYQNGFLHTKMIVIDDEASTVGTANIDVRSFKLNFEVNAFIYDRTTSHQLAEIFEEDMQLSTELTWELYQERSKKIMFKESIARLISPIL
jgi:cardiolipin synthase